jgi:hypothetical protein
MTTYKALYYPYIHFRNDDWVKLAALYWDELSRIVPNDYATEDSDTVRALSPVISTVRPGWVRPEFGQSFIEFIRHYGKRLRAKYALSLRDRWPELPQSRRPPKPGGASGNDPRLGYVFSEKMSLELYAAMQEFDLASTDSRGGQWIGMHPRLAWVYMTTLAEQISKERGLRPLTDQTRDHLAVSGLSTERLAHALLGDVALVGSSPTSSEVETVLVSVAFRAVVPRDLQTLSVDRILEFREKYPNERASFQEEVAKLLATHGWLNEISHPAVLEERLREEYEKVWNPKLASLRAKLKDVGIDTMLSCFSMKTSVPGGLTSAAAAAALALNPVAAGVAGFALAAIPALREKRKSAKEALASPATYLFRMEEDLKPQTLLGKIKKRARQFAFQV